jgi:predicted aldo/keto reductase-like oxidoreductase
MQYRKFGKLDWKGSVLGFGAMRLPQLGKDRMSPIDEPEAIKMIRYAIDNGVNYVDTAFTYNMGGSERVVGKALRDGYREKVRLATKLSGMVLKSPDEFDRYLNAQLKRLQTDKIDFYLLHALSTQLWKQMKEWKAIQFVEKKIAKGKIGYLGFSFHDSYEVFKEIVDYYDNWTFCQVMYNYFDENNQAGRKGVEYAAAKGLAVVVMEPLRGGQGMGRGRKTAQSRGVGTGLGVEPA